MKTIKVSEETYQALLAAKGRLISGHGSNFSFDDVIKFFVATWRDHNQAREAKKTPGV